MEPTAVRDTTGLSSFIKAFDLFLLLRSGASAVAAP